MKRVLIILYIFLTGLLCAQESEDWEDYFYFWDLVIDVEIEYENSETIMKMYDSESEDWYDARNSLSTLLYSIVEELSHKDLSIEHLEYDMLIYSWIDGETERKFYINKEWMKSYFDLKRDKEKTEMVFNLVSSKILLSDTENDLIKRDVIELGEILMQQREIEQDFLNKNIDLTKIE